MTRLNDIVKIVGVNLMQASLISGEPDSEGWRVLRCDEAKEGGWLRDEVVKVLNDPIKAGPVGNAYKLKDGKMWGKTYQNLDFKVLEEHRPSSWREGYGNLDDVTAEFTLITQHRPVRLTILQAKDVVKMDRFGYSDPYVMVWVVNKHYRTNTTYGYTRTDYASMSERTKEEVIMEERKTTIKRQTLNPEWNEEFNLPFIPASEVLVLDVFDWNRVRTDKFIGRAVIEVNDQDEIRVESRPYETLENPLEIKIVNIAGTDVWYDKPCKLFVEFNFSERNYNIEEAEDIIEAASNAAVDSNTNSELNPEPESEPSNQLPPTAAPTDDSAFPELSPLPEDWYENIDQNGRTYYINHATNSFQWERPIIGPVTLESQSSQEGGFQARRLISEEATDDSDWIDIDTEDEQEQENNNDLSTNMPSAPLMEELEPNGFTSQNGNNDEGDIPSAPLMEEEEPIDITSQSGNTEGLFNVDAYREQRYQIGRSEDTSGTVETSIEINSELPSGWTQGASEDGRIFYINNVERQTTWIHPITREPSEKPVQDLGPLPHGWQEKKTADGKSYFINHTTRTTTWEDPRITLRSGTSKIIPYSRNYKAKYEAFMDNQESNAAQKLRTSDKMVIKVHRESVFLDSFDEIMKISEGEIHMLRARLWVEFEGERGLDYGGLAREWFSLISLSMFNPYHGLFEYSANDNYTLQINPQSGVCDENHLEHFKFIGRVAGMAVFHRKLLDGFFIRPFYKMMLKKPIIIDDMEAVDAEYFQSLKWIRDNDPSVLCMTFSVDEKVFGQTAEKDLIPGGSEIDVTEENKLDYIEKIIEWRFISRIREQMDHFMEGFNDVIPREDIQIFDEGELELLLSGIGSIDVKDWKENTRYSGYDESEDVIKWFWKVVLSFGNEMRSRLLQFVTGTSRVPMNGFKELRGSDGAQLFTIENWGTSESLPRAHTCFNRIDLPKYTTYHQLKEKLTMAIEGSAGFEGVD